MFVLYRKESLIVNSLSYEPEFRLRFAHAASIELDIVIDAGLKVVMAYPALQLFFISFKNLESSNSADTDSLLLIRELMSLVEMIVLLITIVASLDWVPPKVKGWRYPEAEPLA